MLRKDGWVALILLRASGAISVCPICRLTSLPLNRKANSELVPTSKSDLIRLYDAEYTPRCSANTNIPRTPRQLSMMSHSTSHSHSHKAPRSPCRNMVPDVCFVDWRPLVCTSGDLRQPFKARANDDAVHLNTFQPSALGRPSRFRDLSSSSASIAIRWQRSLAFPRIAVVRTADNTSYSAISSRGGNIHVQPRTTISQSFSPLFIHCSYFEQLRSGYRTVTSCP
ncbi:hypothetical protein BU26DRAFT_92523 [Trematosphaeria pertusa]|uniref:Secreted protein n=1 Tax=Trematosphaeria pertusa TaxID=390896 RepID=A0A6A6I0N0_9PLEO|nr:uncharacterized protein BU26DRAFT_92523 [Trematosphaeria pertusa]KAF2244054.1 hypothetical protein BU26DRAFT_92523 [Trematosphaeria pertusa]